MKRIWLSRAGLYFICAVISMKLLTGCAWFTPGASNDEKARAAIDYGLLTSTVALNVGSAYIISHPTKIKEWCTIILPAAGIISETIGGVIVIGEGGGVLSTAVLQQLVTTLLLDMLTFYPLWQNDKEYVAFQTKMKTNDVAVTPSWADLKVRNKALMDLVLQYKGNCPK